MNNTTKTIDAFKYIYDPEITNIQKIDTCLNTTSIPYKINGSVFYIGKVYTVEGHGIVITGICRGERLKIGDIVYIGPREKTYYKVRIRSFHNEFGKSVSYLDNHHRGSICIKGIDINLTKNDFKKGMCLISDKNICKHFCYRFAALIRTYNRSSSSVTINIGYTPVIHIGTIKQSARILSLNKYVMEMRINKNPNDVYIRRERRKKLTIEEQTVNLTNITIEKNDYHVVEFKFKMRPEFIEIGNTFTFRSGALVGFGKILDILPIEHDKNAIRDVK